jgi:predicted Zn-dependent protease
LNDTVRASISRGIARTSLVAAIVLVAASSSSVAVPLPSEEHEAAESFNRALEAFADGKLDSAFTLVDQASALVPEEPLYHLLAGQILAARGDTTVATTRLRRAATLNPRDPEPMLTIAVLYMHGGDFDGSKALLDSVLADDPFVARAVYLSGVLEEKRGNMARAEIAYRRAMELDADFPNAPASLAALLRESGRAAESIGFAMKALSNDPDRVSSYVELARCERAAGRHDQALYAAVEGLKTVRMSALLAEQSEALAALGRTEEAAEVLRELLGHPRWRSFARARLSELGYAIP